MKKRSICAAITFMIALGAAVYCYSEVRPQPVQRAAAMAESSNYINGPMTRDGGYCDCKMANNYKCGCQWAREYNEAHKTLWDRILDLF